jgi:RNA polymerase sigma-70 factor (ECF subfamily)
VAAADDVTDRIQDLALIERVAARDPAAVAALHDRHARVLYSLILRIVRDTGDAEDVLQEVFLRLWEKADTYDPVLGSPMAWLVRIARNRAIDRVRARRARPVTQPVDEDVDRLLVETAALSPTPEGMTRESEDQRALRDALARLTPEQRVLIEEAFFLGYTQSELAARFKLPLGTVKTRIRTGMLAMREHLQHLV